MGLLKVGVPKKEEKILEILYLGLFDANNIYLKQI
jgi:hypothetical protein